MDPHYLHLEANRPPPDLKAAPYRVVLVSDLAVDDGWLQEIAVWIVAIGSLYVVAWGVECQKWHDAVDWAVLDSFDFGDIPNEKFVMTTWHSDEPMSEAFWYAGHCAIHPDVELVQTIILHVSKDALSAEMLYAFRQSQVSDEA